MIVDPPPMRAPSSAALHRQIRRFLAELLVAKQFVALGEQRGQRPQLRMLLRNRAGDLLGAQFGQPRLPLHYSLVQLPQRRQGCPSNAHTTSSAASASMLCATRRIVGSLGAT